MTIKYAPIVLAVKKLLTDFRSRNIDINIQKAAGQKASFRCSHTDSFTAEKEPTTILLPDNSNVKCSKLPKIIIKTIPTISIANTLAFLINTYLTFALSL